MRRFARRHQFPSRNVPPILTGWWRAAEAVARLIAWPRTDVPAADAAAAAVFGRSGLVKAGSVVLTVFERAWRGSIARAIVLRIAGDLPATVVLRTRFAAVSAMVAGLTVLALQAVRPGPWEPLAWLLPVMTIAAALLVAAAGAVRRGASGDGRS